MHKKTIATTFELTHQESSSHDECLYKHLQENFAPDFSFRFTDDE